MTIASTLMYAKTQYMFFNVLAFTLLAMLTVIIVTLLFKTGQGMYARELCVEE
jgi:hypothetical protein